MRDDIPGEPALQTADPPHGKSPASVGSAVLPDPGRAMEHCTGGAVLLTAQKLANLESAAQQLHKAGERVQTQARDLNTETANTLLLVENWVHALQELLAHLIERPTLLGSCHIARTVKRCLDAAHPPCCKLLGRVLGDSRQLEEGTWDSARIHAAEHVLQQSADCLTATERWSLLTHTELGSQSSYQLAAAILRHPLTQALPVSTNSWLPPKPLRQWLLLLCLRRSLHWPLHSTALQKLLQATERQAREPSHWTIKWRDPEATLLTIVPPANRFSFSAGHLLPLDGALRWAIPWRALFAVIHQSGHAEQIVHLLDAWQILSD